MAAPEAGSSKNGFTQFVEGVFESAHCKEATQKPSDADKRIAQLCRDLRALPLGAEESARELCQRFLDGDAVTGDARNFTTIKGVDADAVTKWSDELGISTLIAHCESNAKEIGMRAVKDEDIKLFGEQLKVTEGIVQTLIHEIGLRDAPPPIDSNTVKAIAHVKKLDEEKLHEDMNQFYGQREPLIEKCNELATALLSWEGQIYKRFAAPGQSNNITTALYGSMVAHYFDLKVVPPAAEFSPIETKGFHNLQEQLDAFASQLRYLRKEVYASKQGDQSQFYKSRYDAAKRQFMAFLERRNHAIRHGNRNEIDRHFVTGGFSNIGEQQARAYDELLYLYHAGEAGAIGGVKCIQGNSWFSSLDPELQNIELLS